MADQIITVADATSGKKIDASELVVGANSVERQRIVLADDATAAALAKILNSQPAGTEYGLIVREAQKGQTTSANSRPVVLASDHSPIAVTMGSTTGKTNVLKTGSLASSAATADQVVLTYTVTAGKTFYLQYLYFDARLTTFATTATYFGAASLEIVAGTKVITRMLTGAGAYTDVPLALEEPVGIAAGTVVRVVCTPNAATAFTWQAGFGGYEK